MFDVEYGLFNKL